MDILTFLDHYMKFAITAGWIIIAAVWATLRVAEALQLPPEVPVVPLLVIHRAPVPWGGVNIAGVQVIPPSALADALGREAILPTTQVASSPGSQPRGCARLADKLVRMTASSATVWLQP